MRIKELREKNNMSQWELADLLKVNQTAISQWETGITTPRIERLPYLAHLLNCKIDDLYDEGELGIKGS